MNITPGTYIDKGCEPNEVFLVFCQNQDGDWVGARLIEMGRGLWSMCKWDCDGSAGDLDHTSLYYLDKVSDGFSGQYKKSYTAYNMAEFTRQLAKKSKNFKIVARNKVDESGPVTSINGDGVIINAGSPSHGIFYLYGDLAARYNFENGEPCGIEVVEWV